jgi:hypothetical protein
MVKLHVGTVTTAIPTGHQEGILLHMGEGVKKSQVLITYRQVRLAQDKDTPDKEAALVTLTILEVQEMSDITPAICHQVL